MPSRVKASFPLQKRHQHDRPVVAIGGSTGALLDRGKSGDIHLIGGNQPVIFVHAAERFSGRGGVRYRENPWCVRGR